MTFDGLCAADDVHVPALFVHGDGCMLPQNVRRLCDIMGDNARLVWIDGFQVDFYDRPELVRQAVAAADEHFRRTLPWPLAAAELERISSPGPCERA